MTNKLDAAAMPDANGFFGDYGGQLVPPHLKKAMDDISAAYDEIVQRKDFQEELQHLFQDYVGRPSPIFHAKRLSEQLGGAQIHLKREDLNHTGAHKINHCLGEALLAKFMGKTKVIAETGAGQHGVALVGSFIGAWVVTLIDPGFLRRLLPLILLAVLLYTLAKKDLGRTHTPRHTQGRETLLACAIGLVIGWYDGFFGPGTGSFFIFLFVRLLGYDFLNASASAKLLNVATNVAAIALFAMKGHVWWQIGLVMAVANVAGSLIGTRLALKHGAGFVRGVFIVVVGALILKTGYDAFLK